jgi:hypothetical protein
MQLKKSHNRFGTTNENFDRLIDAKVVKILPSILEACVHMLSLQYSMCVAMSGVDSGKLEFQSLIIYLKC